MKNPLCLILALLRILPPLPTQAWSEGGHHLIADMAFRKLPRVKQAELLRILTAHSRFTEAIPAVAGNGKMQDFAKRWNQLSMLQMLVTMAHDHWAKLGTTSMEAVGWKRA